MPGIPSPLANRKPGDIDFVVVRENTEGEYSSVGGRMFEGTDRETVFQQSIFTAHGRRPHPQVSRSSWRDTPARSTSRRRPNRTASPSPCRTGTSAFARCPARYPDIRTDQFHIDILTRAFRPAPRLVRRRGRLQSVRRHPLRPRARRCAARSASRRRRTSIPSAHFPSTVRAGARLGARHRGQGHRQSHRPDLVGGADARPSRPRRGRRRHGACDRSACLPMPARRGPGPISAARRSTDELRQGHRRDDLNGLNRRHELRAESRLLWQDSGPPDASGRGRPA